MKTTELSDLALDWAVAKCSSEPKTVLGLLDLDIYNGFNPSTNWSIGGPIIEREGVNLSAHYKLRTGEWQAWCELGPSAYGPTPLIAAMRCYVANKVGDEIAIPDELITEPDPQQ